MKLLCAFLALVCLFLALLVILVLLLRQGGVLLWRPSGRLAGTPVTPTVQLDRPILGAASCHPVEPETPHTDNKAKARAVAERYHLEPLVLLWQVQQESGFQPSVVSPAGAIGIAQFMPDTARAMGVDPWNVDSSLDGMARYDQNELRAYWDRSGWIADHFGGNRNQYVWGLALAAYNAGGRAINAALAWADRVGWSNPWTWLQAPNGAVGWDEAQTFYYVKDILGCW